MRSTARLGPWWATAETHTSVLAFATNNLDGLSLEARRESHGEGPCSRNWWVLTLSGYGSPPHFDRSRGSATAPRSSARVLPRHRPGYLDRSNGSRSSFPCRPPRNRWRMAAISAGRAGNHTGRPPFRGPSCRILPTFHAQLRRAALRGPPVAAPTDLVFGRLQATSAGATVRASYTFIPTLTLQTYAQMFPRDGATTSTMRSLPLRRACRGPLIRLRDLSRRAGPQRRIPISSRVSLAVNVVLRWGVPNSDRRSISWYTRLGRKPNVRAGRFPGTTPSDPGAIWIAPAADILMLKVALLDWMNHGEMRLHTSPLGT